MGAMPPNNAFERTDGSRALAAAASMLSRELSAAMNGKAVKRYDVAAPEGREPSQARWLWAFEDARRRTKAAIDGLDDAVVNWVPPHGGNGIGTLLYHIAATEMEWICLDVSQRREFPPEVAPLLAYGVRDPEGRLVPVIHESLQVHLYRLEATRAHTLSVLEGISPGEFRRPRELAEYTVTPEWVVYHLTQHEAEHRGQITVLRALASRALGREAAG